MRSKRTSPPVASFNAKYIKKSSGCWMWTAAKDRHGYGVIGIGNGETQLASRFSWELHFGKIKNKLCVCHSCDNPGCVNPSHLFVGTHQHNMRDAKTKNRLSPPPIHMGEAHHKSKLKIKDVKLIRTKYRSKRFSQRQLAKIYRVSQATICSIVRHDSWRSVT